MATILITAPPAPVTCTPHNNHHCLLSILTQSPTISIPHLKRIHTLILRTNPPPHQSHETLFLYSRLLYFSSLQDLTYTSRIFNQIPNPSTFIYNTLIRAYAHGKNHKERAFSLFRELLKNENLLPDKHTFPFVLKACAYVFALREGEQAHAQLLKHGLGSDIYINNSLVHFYASCGHSDSAKKVFDKMPERSLVSWNAIIDALVLTNEFEEALKKFIEMNKWFMPDGYTMQSLIEACAGLGALSLGMWAHASILRKCILIDDKFDILVHNSLVEMYCKCGSWRMAMQVFDGMNKRDINTWNAMILGLAMHGEEKRVFEYFNRMVNEETLQPSSITFIGVLSVCNHRGLISEGRKYFDMMVNLYKIEPVLQHYGCLIDLLARSGLINDALDIVSRMPMRPDSVIWRCLLDASCKQFHGLDSTEKIVESFMADEDSASSGDYVLLSRVHALANRWDEVGLIRKLMMDKGVAKEPGCSAIEINGIAHEFFAGDTTHPNTTELYEFLNVMEERVKFIGYVADSSQAPLVDEVDVRKGNTLRLHSERLAIAFGLLNARPGVPIRIFKNLRVCSDCHNFTKLISKSYNVEIVMRDRIRFHHFRNGLCSCKDFW